MSKDEVWIYKLSISLWLKRGVAARRSCPSAALPRFGCHNA
jgi:hypothetical protein